MDIQRPWRDPPRAFVYLARSGWDNSGVESAAWKTRESLVSQRRPVGRKPVVHALKIFFKVS
jgi:hypothetical protein